MMHVEWVQAPMKPSFISWISTPTILMEPPPIFGLSRVGGESLSGLVLALAWLFPLAPHLP